MRAHVLSCFVLEKCIFRVDFISCSSDLKALVPLASRVDWRSSLEALLWRTQEIEIMMC
jgi:hypothetical protein